MQLCDKVNKLGGYSIFEEDLPMSGRGTWSKALTRSSKRTYDSCPCSCLFLRIILVVNIASMVDHSGLKPHCVSVSKRLMMGERRVCIIFAMIL